MQFLTHISICPLIMLNRVSLALHVQTMTNLSISEKKELEEKHRQLQVCINNYEKRCASMSLFSDGCTEVVVQNFWASKADQKRMKNDDRMQPEFASLFLPSNLSMQD